MDHLYSATDYPALIDAVRSGDPVPSRYGPTYERRYITVAGLAGVVPLRPGAATALGLVEGRQLIGGYFDLEELKAAAPNADHSLFDPRGAYGPRVAEQLPRIIGLLTDDPTTRQAVAYVATAGDVGTSWMPCTSTLHFMIRHGTLILHAVMRSWDLLKGLPADLSQFGLLTMTMALALKVPRSAVRVTAASAHVYEADLAKAPTRRGIRHLSVSMPDEWQLELWPGPPVQQWITLAAMARDGRLALNTSPAHWLE